MIESVIRKALQSIPVVGNNCAKYAGQPAVFYQTAPHDKDGQWDGIQYPRIDYAVDWSYNPERRTSGVLLIDVWCINDGSLPPEEIGELIVAQFNDLFLTDESGTYCTVWNRTDFFDGTGNEPKTIGVTMTFDIVAFPIQTGAEPDPVLAMMNWIKSLQPAASIIGLAEIPDIWKPTSQNPAIYVRVGGGDSSMRPSNAVTWVTQQQTIHVMCPKVQDRQKWMRMITDDMAIYQETVLSDNSPLFVKRLAYNTASNPLTQGQVTATVEYGVLRKYPDAGAIGQINIGM